jgi:S1-C subfamily serine protease
MHFACSLVSLNLFTGSVLGKVLMTSTKGKVEEIVEDKHGVTVIRHTAKTEPGNSGSPLFNNDLNEVAGLHNSGETDKGTLPSSPLVIVSTCVALLRT